MKSLLPIVFIVLALTAAITYTLAKKAAPRDINRFGIAANQLDNLIAPKVGFDTPTPNAPKFVVTPSVAKEATPTAKIGLPEVTESATKSAVASKTKTLKTTKTTKTTICTWFPVFRSCRNGC